MKSQLRSQKGQASVPMILVAVLVIGAVGVFAFEIARTTMIRDQLRTATEAAALGGSATLAGSAELDPLESQNNALKAARFIFEKNEIFGTPLTAVETDYDNNPAIGHAKLKLSYLDPKNGNRVVPVGDKAAKVMLVEAKYGYTPIFANVIGASQPFHVEAQAQGGLGDLDIVLCFDISGSMDDETLMTNVRRRWDPAQGKIFYDVVTQGKLATSNGAVPPQQLAAGGFNGALRGPANTGSPPGNFPPGTAGVNGYTDAVINLDEKTTFAGISSGGFDFPTVDVLVEAARGNLENAAVFDSSEADTALNGIVAPKAGYQAKYFELAKQHVHPMFEAQQEAKEFFTLMNKNANTHFGVVAFQASTGNSPTSTFPQPKISPSYPAGGNGNFPLPTVYLSRPEENTRFNEVNAAVDPLISFGGTNIGGATFLAVEMFNFTNQTRPNAKKAIVILTDGEPTVGTPLSGDPRQNCVLAAQRAKNKGITLYTVGLALDPSLIPIQQQVLGETSSQGMARIAGNGSKFFQATSTANLKPAFASIARHLSQLVD